MKNSIAVKNKQFSIKQLNTSKDDPFTLYLAGLAPSGRRSMKSQLAGVLKLMGYTDDPAQFPWRNLKYGHVVKLRYILIEQGKSANTVNTTMAAISGVMRTAFNMGLISSDDYMRVKLIKRVNNHKLPVGRELKQQEIKKMLACCKRGKNTLGIRDAAIIAVMLSTGLRRSEVVGLNIEDYDVNNMTLVVNHGKGNRQRLAHISVPAKKLLQKWLKLRSDKTGTLFTRVIADDPTDHKLSAQAIYNLIRLRSEQAGIEHCAPHDLRRTLVTRLLDMGVDINTVRQIVGHQNINTTARYDKRDFKIAKDTIRKVIEF